MSNVSNGPGITITYAEMVKAFDLAIADAVSRLMESDPHQFSSRPCQTCTAISSLIGRDYGCRRINKGK